MHSQPTLSLIIPAYQAEQTIIRALQSASSWKGDGLEIIVVDDGSTDTTSSLIEEAASKDARIIPLAQENRGRSAARNMGISHAKAKWIMFLDSDDYLMPGWDDAVKEAANEESDLVIFAYQRGYAQTPLEEQMPVGSAVKAACIDSSEMMRFLIDGSFPSAIPDPRQYEWNSCWARLYRNDTLQSVAALTEGEAFPLGIRFSEDRIFNLEFALNAQRPTICFFSNVIYYWDLAASSTVSSSSLQDAHSILSFSSAVDGLCLDKESAKKLLATETLARFRKSAYLPLLQLPEAAKTWNHLLSLQKISEAIPFIPQVEEGKLWFNRLPAFGLVKGFRFLALLYWHIIYKLADIAKGPQSKKRQGSCSQS